MSIVGALFVTVSWYFIPSENKGFAKKLLAWLSIADLLSSAVFLSVGSMALGDHSYMSDSASCSTIGAFVSFTVAAGFLWHLVIAQHMYEKIRSRVRCVGSPGRRPRRSRSRLPPDGCAAGASSLPSALRDSVRAHHRSFQEARPPVPTCRLGAPAPLPHHPSLA